jgi:hypothetical protein
MLGVLGQLLGNIQAVPPSAAKGLKQRPDKRLAGDRILPLSSPILFSEGTKPEPPQFIVGLPRSFDEGQRHNQ